MLSLFSTNDSGDIDVTIGDFGKTMSPTETVDIAGFGDIGDVGDIIYLFNIFRAVETKKHDRTRNMGIWAGKVTNVTIRRKTPRKASNIKPLALVRLKVTLGDIWSF
jgi:hypothetical protein